MSRHAFTVSFARTRGGRALLHALCLARGRNLRWHLGGIVRELFGPHRRGDSRRTTNPLAPSSHRLWLALLLPVSFLAIVPLPARAALPVSESPAIRLLPVAQVDGSGIFLHQIAAVTGIELGTVPLRLASAPAFGRTLSLSRDQIAAALQTMRPDLAGVGWTGADTVRLTRRNRLLAESELKELLTRVLQNECVKDRGELELRLARPWTSVHVPDEPLQIKILDLPSAGVSQHFVVRFAIVAGDDHLGPWQAVTQARIMKNVLVAATTTRRGEIMQAADVTVERRDLLTLREPLDESALRGAPLEFVEMIPAGQPVLNRAVRPRPVVQRGMMVDGLVRDGSLQIVLKVEVLGDGLPGQLVRVRNPKTRREFYAKVKDEQTVFISL
jgi:flagella basal body P-ring formation protein FlgA